MEDLVNKAEKGELDPAGLEELREKVITIETQGTGAITPVNEATLGRAHAVLNNGAATF